MSRSGYSDDCDGWALIRWRGAVRSAIRGKRGQAFLREMADALDAIPNHRLIEEELVTPEGEVCAMGAVAVKRAMDVSEIDPYERESVAAAFGIPKALACEIAYLNDEVGHWQKTPEARWVSMRKWVAAQLGQKFEWREPYPWQLASERPSADT